MTKPVLDSSILFVDCFQFHQIQ